MTSFSISGKTSFRLSAIAVASVLALSACSKGQQQQQQAPELVVSVLTVKADVVRFHHDDDPQDPPRPARRHGDVQGGVCEGPRQGDLSGNAGRAPDARHRGQGRSPSEQIAAQFV